MIHSYFKSEDFEPKRLVWMGKRKGKWGSPRSKQAPVRRTLAQMEQYRANLEAGRKRALKKLQKDIEEKTDGVNQEINEYKAKNLVSELQGKYSNKNGWREWNKRFAGDDPKKARERIMDIQRVVFSKLGILGDPSAAIDGKLGPYTLAAIAAASGTKGIKVPISNRNTALRDFVAGNQGESAEFEDQEIAEKPKEDEDENKAEKAKKEKEYAKIKANLAKNEKEIDKKREEVEGLDKELKKRRNFNKTQWGNIRKKLDAQADKEEKELRDVKFELTRLEGVAGKLEEKQDIALFGPESVAKRKLEKVEEEIRTLWKKLNAYKAELPDLKTMVEAGLNKAETMLGNKKAQIQQTKDELWKKEQEAKGLKALRQAHKHNKTHAPIS